jgi:hypothetical protein
LLLKLSEKYNNLVTKFSQELFELFIPLSTFILEFGYVTSELDINNISKDILYYGLDLIRSGAYEESLYNYEQAHRKYKCAQFVAQEI